jgi:hypothetical protein
MGRATDKTGVKGGVTVVILKPWVQSAAMFGSLRRVAQGPRP